MIRHANCKINLGLDVLRRREDGYHELATVMYPVVGLYDRVEVVPAAESSFRAEGLAVDCSPEENLCMKAVRLMQR
ncbi:MAG: 4-(cytidine 5'-diphospho)-2-C-methyl-D-erythritol kinase, partial [Alistipes sp.]|nr:4-(cytidine 5'-diphospho)-2-C-methyl-D-erythritol kinase [Alistipes sp.]